MVNHSAQPSCSVILGHLGLEKADQQVRQEKEYQKVRGNYDLTAFVEDSHFHKRLDESSLCQIADLNGQKVENSHHLDLAQERDLALGTINSLLHDEELGLQIWDFPGVDRSDDDSDEEKNLKPYNVHLPTNPIPAKKPSKFKQKLESLRKKLAAARLKEGDKSRQPELGDHPTNLQTTETPDSVCGESCPDRYDAEASYRRKYPWYDPEDTLAGMFLVNTTNKVIKAGTQICISYGRKPNAELCDPYGFALEQNPDDWCAWNLKFDEHLNGDSQIQSEGMMVQNQKEESQEIMEEKPSTTPFWVRPKYTSEQKLRPNCFCIAAVRALRKKLLDRNQSASLNKRSAALDLEMKILSSYSKTLQSMLKRLNKKQEEPDEPTSVSNMTPTKKAVMLVESGWKELIEEHQRLCKFLSAVLAEVSSNTSKPLKQTYLQAFEEVDTNESPNTPGFLMTRIKVKEYLQDLNEILLSS